MWVFQIIVAALLAAAFAGLVLSFISNTTGGVVTTVTYGFASAFNLGRRFCDELGVCPGPQAALNSTSSLGDYVYDTVRGYGKEEPKTERWQEASAARRAKNLGTQEPPTSKSPRVPASSAKDPPHPMAGDGM